MNRRIDKPIGHPSKARMLFKLSAKFVDSPVIPFFDFRNVSISWGTKRLSNNTENQGSAMDFNDPRIDLLDKAISQRLVKPKGIMVSPDFFNLLQQSGRLSEERSALTNTPIFRVDNEIDVTKADLPEHEPFRLPPEY